MRRYGRLFSGQRRATGGWYRTRAALAVLGVVLCLVAAVDLSWPGVIAAQEEFSEPTELRAVNGVLHATLTAAEQEIDLAGERVRARPPVSIPASVATGGDLDAASVAAKRDIFFSDDWDLPGPPIYKVNGQLFDPNRVDERVDLETVEEWTIYNVTPEQHPFHLHVNDFQVMSINDQPYNAAGLQDVVAIPANRKVVIRAPFVDFGGKFVLHCHILYHEDHAMMAVVEVVES